MMGGEVERRAEPGWGPCVGLPLDRLPLSCHIREILPPTPRQTWFGFFSFLLLPNSGQSSSSNQMRRLSFKATGISFPGGELIPGGPWVPRWPWQQLDLHRCWLRQHWAHDPEGCWCRLISNLPAVSVFSFSCLKEEVFWVPCLLSLLRCLEIHRGCLLPAGSLQGTHPLRWFYSLQLEM